MIAALIYLAVYISVVGVVVWLLYLVSTLPVPMSFAQIARVVILVVGCLIVLLLQFVGIAGIAGIADSGLPNLRSRP